MTAMTPPQTLPAWRVLRTHRRESDAGVGVARSALCFEAPGIFADLSHAVPEKRTLDLLLQLAQQTGVADRIEALFCGEMVNASEGRPALHPLLRAEQSTAPALDEVYGEMRAVRRRAEALVNAVRGGRRLGFSGAPFRDAVHVGIGGSLLGPRLLTQALAARRDGLRCHFLGGIDCEEWDAVTDGLDPQSTLFIIASKSGGTHETLQNFRSARKWLQSAAGKGADVSGHFAFVTADPAAAQRCGVSEEMILPLQQSIGGRYSLWSSMALPLALRDGNAQWRALLQGAAQMDAHFRHTPPEKNLPLLLGLLDVWHTSFCEHQSRVVVPYAWRLRSLPEFLQQLLMESNGKAVRSDGTPVRYPTAPALWGGVGTESQHSFHQWLYQGTVDAPVEFVLVRRSRERRQEARNRELWAHCLAQMQALERGHDLDQATAELMSWGRTKRQALAEVMHHLVPGGRPVTLLAAERLDARHLGALLALWEHRVYTSAAVWGVNCFDQWGVELGKKAGAGVRAALDGQDDADVLPAVRRWTSLYRA